MKNKKVKKKKKRNYLQWKTLTLFLLLLILFLIIILLVSLENVNEEEIYTPGEIRTHELEKGNGMVTNIWLHEEFRLDKLRENNMKYLFVDVGNTNKKGVLETESEEIEEFLNFIEEYENRKNYNFILLAYSEINTNDYDINSLDFQDNFIDDYVYLVNIGFEGILIDIEYVPKDRAESYLKITDSLVEKLPDEAIVSAYVVGVDENPSHWDWTPEFFEAVSNRVDLIEFGSYDTGIIILNKYKKHVEAQVDWIASQKWNSYFIITIPTHKGFPETIDNALDSFDSGISKHSNNQFIGAAIFAEWTIDESEWEIFENWYNAYI